MYILMTRSVVVVVWQYDDDDDDDVHGRSVFDTIAIATADMHFCDDDASRYTY